ncbi:hypothetical protein ANCCAN_03198, partial [Ancylostoma caninum]
TLHSKRRKHHRKRNERKVHKEDVVKVRKCSFVAVSENRNRLSEKNDYCGKIEALKNKKEALVYNPRPEYGKDNWREVEIWREIRRREKESGDEVKKLNGPKCKHHFVPNRYR